MPEGFALFYCFRMKDISCFGALFNEKNTSVFQWPFMQLTDGTIIKID